MATKNETKKKAATQRAAAKGTWGGARRGAGRKPGPNPKVGHRARAAHDARHPVLVTLKRADGVPSLRGGSLLRLVRDAIRDTGDAGLRGFRVVLFAVAAAQLSLVVEADDVDALGRGVRSVSIRIARRANALLGRDGHIWGDRYRVRVLATSNDIRDVILRVLARAKEAAEQPRTSLLRKQP